MSLPNDIESCLASLDSPVLIHLNQTSSHRPLSPSPSTKNIILHSARPRSDSFRRPYNRSPLGDPTPADHHNVPARARSSSRASSFTGSVIVRHDSRYSMRPSVSNSFQALPPILSGSSVHFHTNLDFNFQSFMISSGNAPRSRRASRLSETPPALPPLPSLSQPLFPPVAETTQKDLFQIPSLRHPNSPYVPWDSPMRRQIFLTPESSDSLPGHTENVTRVPEPMDLLDGSQKVVKSSWGIGKVHRTVKNVAGFAKRMFMRQKQARVSAASPLVAINTHLSDGSFNPPVYPPSPGVASFDSSNTRSLALWLDARRQETLEWDADSRHFITLEEYERRGSWTNFAGERDFVCSVPGCSIHSRLSNAITTIDLELNVLSCDQQVDDNVEQQQDMDAHRVSHDSDKTAVSEENPHEKSEELESFVLRVGC